MTRDRVTYDATWRGRAFTLVDTGGWEPEVEGSRSLAARVAAQARVAVDAADAVLFVVDAVVGVTDADDGRRRGAAPVPQAGRARREQGRRRAGGVQRQLAVVARPGRAVLGQRAARPGQRRPAGRDARRAARGAGGAVRRGGRPAPGGADRPAQRGQVQPAQQAGRAGAGAGRRGRRAPPATRWTSSSSSAARPGGSWTRPGIRRRMRETQGADYFAALRTESALERAEVAVVLIDASEPLAEQDLRIVSMVIEAGPGAGHRLQQVGHGRRGPPALPGPGDRPAAAHRPLGAAGQHLGRDRLARGPAGPGAGDRAGQLGDAGADRAG